MNKKTRILEIYHQERIIEGRAQDGFSWKFNKKYWDALNTNQRQNFDRNLIKSLIILCLSSNNDKIKQNKIKFIKGLLK